MIGFFLKVKYVCNIATQQKPKEEVGGHGGGVALLLRLRVKGVKEVIEFQFNTEVVKFPKN